MLEIGGASFGSDNNLFELGACQRGQYGKANGNGKRTLGQRRDNGIVHGVLEGIGNIAGSIVAPEHTARIKERLADAATLACLSLNFD